MTFSLQRQVASNMSLLSAKDLRCLLTTLQSVRSARVNDQKSPDIPNAKRGRNLLHLIDTELFAYL
jgi:hypothetical protein